jgi:hypothetical protein
MCSLCAMVISRSQLQEGNRFFHETLRSQEVSILEVAIVKTRQLVARSFGFSAAARKAEISILILDGTTENCNLLDERLQGQSMGRVARQVGVILIRK